MSGFETGVAVMTHVEGDPGDTEPHPAGRIRGTKRMLSVAAAIMSVFLVTSSFVTTLLIPPPQFQDGGAAFGRALAYLAHGYLGNGFGTVYDAQHDRDPLVRRRLGDGRPAEPDPAVPARATAWRRTGPAPSARWCWCSPPSPSWSPGSSTPTSTRRAAPTPPACWCCSPRPRSPSRWPPGARGQRRLAVGVRGRSRWCSSTPPSTTSSSARTASRSAPASSPAILAVSLGSRLSRSFELRATDVRLDATAELFLRDCARRTIRLVANEPDARDREEYDDKLRQIRADHDLPDDTDVIFVEVTVTDPSEFERRARRARRGAARRATACCTLESASVPNALAALLLHVRDLHRRHARTSTSSGPRATRPRTSLRFLLFGVGRGRAR